MKKLNFQIVVDCRGEAVQERHGLFLEAHVAAIVGAQAMDRAFWMTRTDLYHDYWRRHEKGPKIAGRAMSYEPFHEQSFDLYLGDRDENVPIGRLVNVKLPIAEGKTERDQEGEGE